jgi:hypothetical protein
MPSIQPSTIGPSFEFQQGIATVQIEQVESPALLPTLDALDAEFGCDDEQCAPGRRKQGGAPMDSTFRPTQSEFPTHPRAARPTVGAIKPSSLDGAIMRPSLARRVLRRLARFLIVFGVGVGTILAWQSYGDAARATIANLSPQLGWLAPQTAPVVPIAPAPAGAASSDAQQLAFGLAAVRQSVDLLTAQLAAGEGQVGADIAKLQADQQEILHKLSAGPPRPTAAPAHKPVPLTPPPSPSVQAR